MRREVVGETKLVLLLALAIFSTEFVIMVLIELTPLAKFTTPVTRVIIDACILVLAVSPLLIIPERRIKEAKNKLKMILDEVGDGILTIDRDYNIVTANPAIGDLFGLMPEEVVGRKCYEIIKSERCNTESCCLRQILSGRSVVKGERYLNRKWIQDVTTPYTGVKGDVRGIIKSMRDVTRQKEDKERIKRLASILRAIRNVNQLITKEPDTNKMLSGACRILLEVREYFHVAIATYDGNQIRKIAESGTGGFFEVKGTVPLCVGQAVKSGKAVIFDDTKEHCGKCPFHKQELKYSAAIIPFKTSEGVVLLAVFADIDRFDEEELSLLTEVAGDIGFAMDKRRAEKEREDQRKLINTIINSTPDLVAFKDENFVYRLVNEAFCQFVGKKECEIIGKTDFDIFSQDMARAWRGDDERVLRSGKPLVKDDELTGVNGKRWFLVLKAPVHDVSGSITGILSSVRDISDRKRMEDLIRESEEKYRLVTENAYDLISLLDLQGRRLYCNSAFKRVLGYDIEELIGGDFVDLIHPEEREYVKQKFKLLLQGKSGTIETRILCKDGSYKWVESRGNLIYGRDKKPETVLIITRDITMRKNYENRLERLNMLLRATSEVNEVVARENNPETLMTTICEKLSVLYSAVFTALNIDEKLVPVKSIGIPVKEVKMAIGNCPAIASAMDGRLMKSNIESPLCKQCLRKYPHRFVLSLPLIYENRNYGVVTIHSSSDFIDEEVELLQKLSRNIAFALNAYEVEQDKQMAFEQLMTNLTQFEVSADRLRNPLAIIMSALELRKELGYAKVLELIDEQARRIKEQLDEMRSEEMRTYNLTERALKWRGDSEARRGQFKDLSFRNSSDSIQS